VQLYSYFVSQSSEFYRHKPLCYFSTSVYCCNYLLRYRLNPETFGYTLVHGYVFLISEQWSKVSVAHSLSNGSSNLAKLMFLKTDHVYECTVQLQIMAKMRQDITIYS